MIFLDSNVVISLINSRSALVRQRFNRYRAAGETIFISSIVLFELRFGAGKSRNPPLNESLLASFLAGPVMCQPLEEDDAMSAGALRAMLEAAGTPIGPYDVLIAGQALRHGATLVTSNTREFQRVPGLKVEDWAKP